MTPDDLWEQSPALSLDGPVRVVAAAGGCVVAAGERFHLLRPGSERFRSPETRAGKTMTALAVEPWSPYRVAIAWPGHVGVFSGHRPHEPLVEMEFPKPGTDATHLAWTRDPDGIHLVARRRTGDVVRLDPKGTTDTLDVPPTMAITGDERGALALVANATEDDGAVWIFPPGEMKAERRLLPVLLEPDEEDGPDDTLALALHGPAVAFSFGADEEDPTGGALVSFRAHDDASECFARPPAVLSGPLAFESADVIYAAHDVAGRVDVLRWARGGGVTRVARFGLDDQGQGTPATVTGLAWDGARRALWVASPELGLVRLHAPVTMGETRKLGAARPAAKTPAPAPAHKASLPSRVEEIWDGGFILDQAQRVVDVRAGRGLVLAGGDSMFMLRPGAETWKAREPPEGLGAVLAVAPEPGAPYRYAFACENGISVYGLPKDQVLTLRAPSQELLVTHLAWGKLGAERVLYIRWDDGNVGRLRIDLGEIEPLPIDPMDALAADADGVLALISVLGAQADAHALVTVDGERFEERPALAAPDGVPDARVHLAVAGMAVAYAVEGWGAHVSRGVDDDFSRCDGIPGGGPLAFQGPFPRAALFGVGQERSLCVIHRVDPGGAVQRIVELEGEGSEPPRFSSITWDESRRVLWSASPQAGIMRSEEPRGKGGKKRSLS